MRISCIRTRAGGYAGLHRTVLDTGAFSLWVDATYIEKMGGILFADTEGAVPVEGSSIPVSGKGSMTFQLWRSVFKDYPVRVMKILLSKVLIGRKF